MNRSRFPRFMLFLLFIFAVLVPLGFIITAIWNSVLVALFHLPLINFWQSLGLFALSRILFGGFPGRPGWGRHGHRRGQMEEMRNKWFNMSPEEKKNFKSEWKNRCGRSPFGGPAEPSTAAEQAS